MSTLIKLNNGLKIPSIGFGVYLTPPNEAKKIVSTALKAGYRHIDCAHYYFNEKEVCEAIADYMKETGLKREEFFYTTKLFHDDHGYEETKKSIKERLALAAPIGYIDLFLIHSPLSNYERRHGSWMAMQEAVEEGTIKSIGVSNYGVHHLKELLAYPDLKIKPVVNQVELHPWLTRNDIVEFCEQNDIKLEAYSPLVRGYRFGDPDVVALSKKYNATEAQIFIKWSLQKGFITLPKSATESRIISNLQVNFELTKEEVDKLSAKDEYFVSEPAWDPTVYPLDSDK